MIGTLERAPSREIHILSLAPGQVLPGLPDIVANLMAGLDTYDSVVPTAEITQAFGVKQTKVDDFVLGMLAGMKRA